MFIVFFLSASCVCLAKVEMLCLVSMYTCYGVCSTFIHWMPLFLSYPLCVCVCVCVCVLGAELALVDLSL